MKTLLVAFQRFAGHEENPSELVARAVNREDVESVILPVSYNKVLGLTEIIKEQKPDFIITMNLSPFRHEPAIEEYAYNEMNSVQADEDGETRNGQKILEDGPASANAVLDISSIQQYLSSQGLSISISIDPGRFVCNEASYLARITGIPTVSLHLPLVKDFPVYEGVELIEHLIEYFEAIA